MQIDFFSHHGTRSLNLDESPVGGGYVTPSHQFPMGACMSLTRKLALLKMAYSSGAWIVEDDYDAEFRYTSPPLPSLQSLDEPRKVIYIGSFSKTLFPGLRIGYVVLPPELVDSFAALKSIVDDFSPLIDQATLATFIESGAFYSHLRRCCKHYAERQSFFPIAFAFSGLGPRDEHGRIAAGRNKRCGVKHSAPQSGTRYPPVDTLCDSAGSARIVVWSGGLRPSEDSRGNRKDGWSLQ
jgi:hypothetical protein